MKLYIYITLNSYQGFPGGSAVKHLPANAGDSGLIPGLGRSEGKWQPTPVFLPRESIDRGAWWATVHGTAKLSSQDCATKTTITELWGRKDARLGFSSKGKKLSLYLVLLVSSGVDRYLEFCIPSPTLSDSWSRQTSCGGGDTHKRGGVSGGNNGGGGAGW